MSKLAKALTAAAGNAAGESLYVEDVFSTYLYTGADANETVTNGIDLAGEGGFVWIKPRSTAGSHLLYDTERGISTYLQSHTTAAASSAVPLGSFNSDGFTTFAYAPATYASWTFRKAEKFFDVVTYTGNSTSGRAIAHNLGSTPGFVIVKCTSDAEFWRCFHITFSAGDDISLNDTGAVAANGHFPTVPDSDNFYVGAGNQVNGTGKTYVAYVFASDAGGFGDDDESIIKCGSFTADGNGAASVNLGFEPQWILHKTSSTSGSWGITDSMRGMPATGSNTSQRLEPNSSLAEETRTTRYTNINSTGFNVDSPANSTSIYIAIRRPMKTPESGTEVFTPNSYSGNSTADRTLVSSNSPVDLGIVKKFNGNGDWLWSDRLRGAGQTLYSNYTQAESVANPPVYITGFDLEDGMEVGSHLAVNASGNNYISYMFTRATGFFDVVAYTGDGASSRDINHNLAAVPEFIVTKRRDVGGSWAVYHPDLGITSTSGIRLNTDDGWGYSQLARYPSTPTSTVYTIGNDTDVNSSGNTFVSYLWATVAGVSKVGGYTGTGADLNVDCGFSAGARFVMIKRYGTSTTGDWYVWDSARGIVAGNDPYVLINSQAGEVTSTDYIDPLSSGFTVTSSAPAALNASGGTYIFLAIA